MRNSSERRTHDAATMLAERSGGSDVGGSPVVGEASEGEQIFMPLRMGSRRGPSVDSVDEENEENEETAGGDGDEPIFLTMAPRGGGAPARRGVVERAATLGKELAELLSIDSGQPDGGELAAALRRDDIVLAAALQDGALGKIETEAKNAIALRD